MSQQKDPRGGAGRGQGRKPLTPTEPTVKVAVTLLESQVEAMKQLGNGNLSAGIRKAIDMNTLTQKRKTEIANALLKDSEFDSTPLKHLRPAVRQMILEAIDTALQETYAQTQTE